MSYQKLSGIIINRRIIRDNDRYLTIYTDIEGKISVFARGVRSAKSKRASQIDLFSHIKFEVYEKNERLTLSSVELLSSYSSSKSNLHNISRLFEIGELIDLLTAEKDSNMEVYELLHTALSNLSNFDTPEYLFRFKKKLLTILGYWNNALTQDSVDNYIGSLVSFPLRAKIKS